MKIDVEEIPFSELLSEVIDNRGKTCPTAETGIPLIATNCVRNEFLYPTYDTVRFVSKETYDTWFRGHPEPGDIIFVNKATPGRVCLVPDPVDFCIAQDMVAVRAKPNRVYPKYLFAVLRSPMIQEKIAQMHVGTLIPHFKKGDFDKLLLPIPGRKEQEFVGDTYFEFSAKIDLNRRMNETLEAMARALFMSWFVNFDPVRAKAEGRDPGFPKSLADLFPDSFQDSELGEIPKGWKIGVVDDLADVSSGKRPEVSYAEASAEAHVPLWGGNGPMAFVPSALIDHPILLTGRVGTLGSVFRITTPCWPSDNTLILRTKIEAAFEYLFFQLREIDFSSLNRGSTQPLLTQTDLKAQPLVLPPVQLLSRFHTATRDMYLRSDESRAESRTLAEFRDTLLPKLISGELRVLDAGEKLMTQRGQADGK